MVKNLLKTTKKIYIIGFSSIVFALSMAIAPLTPQVGPIGPQTAHAACSVSKFKVVWGTAGVYRYRDANSQIIGYKHYGNVVTGYTGGTYSGFTHIYMYDQWGNSSPGYMKDPAVQFISCV